MYFFKKIELNKVHGSNKCFVFLLSEALTPCEDIVRCDMESWLLRGGRGSCPNLVRWDGLNGCLFNPDPHAYEI
jgi:hypothetical protein